MRPHIYSGGLYKAYIPHVYTNGAWVSYQTALHSGGDWVIGDPPVDPNDRSGLVAGEDEPTLLNTGVYSGVSRTSYTSGGFTSFPSGTYDDLNFSSLGVNGLTVVSGRTYTFNNCDFTSTGVAHRFINASGSGTWSLTFNDCSFNTTWPAHQQNNTTGGHYIAALAIRGHHYTVNRCQFRGFNDPIGVGSITGASGVIIQQSYMDNFCYWRPDQNGRVEGTHNDGVAVDGGTGTVIRGNTILGFNDPTIGDAQYSQFTGSDGRLHGLEAGNDPEQWMNGAPIFLRASGSSVNNTVIDRNWLTGGQVQINISGSSGTITGTTVTGNRMGNNGTIDEGRYGTNVWFHAASRTAATDVSGNVQMNGSPAQITNT